MKHKITIQFLFLILFSFSLFSQNTDSSREKNTLLLMHPSVGTISLITYLMDEGIFPLENYQIKGVYFAKEITDYSESVKYIREKKLSIVLEKVDLSLNPDHLYEKNPCSPAFEKLFSESSGVIFFGGPDIPPHIYGEKTNTLTGIDDPYRHYFEASFLFHLLGGFQNEKFVPLLDKNPDYMVVGFCLGMQTMNVATGGTLIQDIPLEVYNQKYVEDILSLPVENLHRNYSNNIPDITSLFWGNIHPIKITDESWIVKQGLAKADQLPVVVSSHHQAAEKTGLNLKIAATSTDGKIIEALEHTKFPNVIGFQFHPEVPEIYNYDNTYRSSSAGEPFSLRAAIETGKGYEFHIAFWKRVAEILEK
jgi:putative glutamine amidotransferase